MISVEWYIPEEDKKPPPPPVDQQPPAFNGERVYAGYTLTLKGKSKYQPPWFPEAVVDDGQNTLIKFRTDFKGIALPIVSAVRQDGQPALVQSRLYVREGVEAAWIWVQNLHPALRLKDAAGIIVEAVRKVPQPQELIHENLKLSEMDGPATHGDARDGADEPDAHGAAPGTHRGDGRPPRRLGAEQHDEQHHGVAGRWERDRRPGDDDHDHDGDDVFALQLDLGT